MGNAREFSIEIDKELSKAEALNRRIIRAVALEALSRVVLKTPVDTGRARGNWFVQIGSTGTEVTSEVDPSGSVTISKGGSVIGSYERVNGYPKIVIYNNLPYINRLENGYSGQAPSGMVAITVAELQSTLS